MTDLCERIAMRCLKVTREPLATSLIPGARGQPEISKNSFYFSFGIEKKADSTGMRTTGTEQSHAAARARQATPCKKIRPSLT